MPSTTTTPEQFTDALAPICSPFSLDAANAADYPF
jgi:hypothetical protein